jgi:hypothetical protein
LSKNQANCNKIYNIKIQILTKNVNLRIQCINTEILITEMGVSDEAKNESGDILYKRNIHIQFVNFDLFFGK